MQYNIFLAEACQNTFLLVDCLDQSKVSQAFLDKIHKALLVSERDDAMILINGHASQSNYTFEMLVLGADKKLGAFCGNGSRSVAAYVFQQYPQFHRFYIKTPKALHELLKGEDGQYTTILPNINSVPNQEFIADLGQMHEQEDGFQYELDGIHFQYLEILEPHLVTRAPLSDVQLEAISQKINQNKSLFPGGMNVTAYQKLTDNHLQAVTYERGIQRFTKSCGTGACCVAAHYSKHREGLVAVQNPGGVINILLKANETHLTGPAEVSF